MTRLLVLCWSAWPVQGDPPEYLDYSHQNTPEGRTTNNPTPYCQKNKSVVWEMSTQSDTNNWQCKKDQLNRFIEATGTMVAPILTARHQFRVQIRPIKQ